MNKKEEEKIKKEIDYWSNHQELDKFNFQWATSVHLAFLALFFSIYLIFFSLMISSDDVSVRNIVILSIIITIAIVYVSVDAKNKMVDANEHFITREEMIKKRYEKLGVNKDHLNKEFVKVRNKLFKKK